MTNPVMQDLRFANLDDSLWRETKSFHTTMFSIGTLLVLPGIGISYLAGIGLSQGQGDPHLIAAALATLVSTTLGGFAWVALGLLFFKRADLLWQRACWCICSTFGWVTLPSLIGVLIYLMNDAAPMGDETILFFALVALIFGTALAAAVHGMHHARRAAEAIRASSADRNTAFPRPDRTIGSG